MQTTVGRRRLTMKSWAGRLRQMFSHPARHDAVVPGRLKRAANQDFLDGTDQAGTDARAPADLCDVHHREHGAHHAPELSRHHVAATAFSASAECRSR